jgi:uncharacterized protein (UPF0276 family)
MYLAINYSTAAAKLIQAGEINIEYFKTPDWDWMIEEAKTLRPVAVHFTLEAGNDSLGEVDWEKVRQLSQITHTPYVNLHLDARQSTYPGISVDTSNADDMKTVLNTIFADVTSVVERFGPDRVILENSPYRGEDDNTMRLCVLPEIITRILNDTGTGLLLDISHAIISAHHLGMDTDDYITRLPMHRLKEMHFAGVHQNRRTRRWMDHLSIQESDWHWLDWVLNRIHSGEWNSPWLLAFEYGGVGGPFEWRTDLEVIREQVPAVYKHINLLKP